jgi:hypothetical protein
VNFLTGKLLNFALSRRLRSFVSGSDFGGCSFTLPSLAAATVDVFDMLASDWSAIEQALVSGSRLVSMLPEKIEIFD